MLEYLNQPCPAQVYPLEKETSNICHRPSQQHFGTNYQYFPIPLASMVNPFNDAKTDFEKISNIGTFGDLEIYSIVENISTSKHVLIYRRDSGFL
jgi:hypothetical protein